VLARQAASSPHDPGLITTATRPLSDVKYLTPRHPAPAARQPARTSPAWPLPAAPERALDDQPTSWHLAAVKPAQLSPRADRQRNPRRSVPSR